MPLFQHTDERGKVFTLVGNADAIITELTAWMTAHEDPDNDYSIESCQAEYKDEIKPEDRSEETTEIAVLIAQIEENQFEDWFKKIPFKKNGTFHKNRVLTLWRGYTFEHYWEDSYGYNGPELVIETIDDHTAELRTKFRTRKF